jgi:hypothetical protein
VEVTVTPVNWLGRTGEEVETVVAVLLSRRFPRAERIQASRGDGGIDVQVPNEDGWDIYQIKNYTTRFYKDKVKKSYDRLREYTADEGMNIKSWNLIMPMNASKEARKWFRELTIDAGYPCGIPGKIFVENLASEYQNVIDYYWGDGKQELVSLIGQVANFRNVTDRAKAANEDAPITPADISSALADIFKAINKCDPHFNYAYSVDPRMPAIHPEPGLIYQSTTGKDGCFVTYKIFPNYAAVTEDRPIKVTLDGEVPPGSPDERGLQEFLNYGVPYKSVTACLSIVADAPGGLRDALPMGKVFLGPTAEEEARPDHPGRLQILNESEEVIAECVILQRPTTTGPRRRGYRTIGRDPGGAFSFEHIVDVPEGNFRLTITHHALTGLDPSAILPGFAVVAAFHAPNSWRIGGRRGRITEKGYPITIESPTPGFAEALEVIRALADIQQHTDIQLTVPALETLSKTALSDILLPWYLSQGQTITQHLQKFTMIRPTRHDEAPMSEGGPQNIMWTCPLVARVGAAEVTLGTQKRAAEHVDISLTTLPGGVSQYTLTPHDGETFRMFRALEEAGDN